MVLVNKQFVINVHIQKKQEQQKLVRSHILQGVFLKIKFPLKQSFLIRTHHLYY